MTNLEKLVQILWETFPGVKFDIDDVIRRFNNCNFMICPTEGLCDPGKCPVNDFWQKEYVLHDLKPEPDDDILIGYIVMVDDEGNQIPYSGCIHPDFHHASDEVDHAEYHGWMTSIKPVTFQLVTKGGGKNA